MLFSILLNATNDASSDSRKDSLSNSLRLVVVISVLHVIALGIIIFPDLFGLGP